MLTIVACKDLLIGSRLERFEELNVRRVAQVDRIDALLSSLPAEEIVVVVDLEACFEIAELVGGEWRDRCSASVGFAPHVREDLLVQAEQLVDVVAPRGAAAAGLPRLVAQARTKRGCAEPRGMA
jgi:hypothetical protein